MHTILLLTISNIFMTFARYGHLKRVDLLPPYKIFLSKANRSDMKPAIAVGHYHDN